MAARRPVLAGVLGLSLLVASLLPRSAAAAEPTIVCPPGVVTVSTVKMGQVVIDLPIHGADSIYMPAGSWKNGRFMFVASRQGPWALTVFAFSGGERTSCVIRVNVRFDDTAASQFVGEQPSSPPPDAPAPQTNQPGADRLDASSPLRE